MDTPIILAVLAAAFFHALWNATVKRGGDKILSLAGMQFTTLLIVLPLAPLVGVPQAGSWPYLAASAVLHFGYYLALANAYRHGDFSQTYPVARGSAPVLVTLWGVFVLHEALGGAQLFSVIAVMCGILIFASRGLGKMLRRGAGLPSAFATSCFIAAYTIVDGVGARLSLNVPAYMVWLSILDAVPMTLYALHQRSWSAVAGLRRGWRVSLFASLLSLAAYWVVVWAMTRAPIPLVSALRETSVVIAALIGAFYFKEPAGRRRIVASAVILAGIALPAWWDS